MPRLYVKDGHFDITRCPAHCEARMLAVCLPPYLFCRAKTDKGGVLLSYHLIFASLVSKLHTNTVEELNWNADFLKGSSVHEDIQICQINLSKI